MPPAPRVSLRHSERRSWPTSDLRVRAERLERNQRALYDKINEIRSSWSGASRCSKTESTRSCCCCPRNTFLPTLDSSGATPFPPFSYCIYLFIEIPCAKPELVKPIEQSAASVQQVCDPGPATRDDDNKLCYVDVQSGVLQESQLQYVGDLMEQLIDEAAVQLLSKYPRADSNVNRICQ